MNIGITELIVVLVAALVIFGPERLPELGNMAGKMLREFKGAINNIDEDIKKDLGDIKNEVQEVKEAVDVRSTIADLKNDVKSAVKIDLTTTETAKVEQKIEADTASAEKAAE